MSYILVQGRQLSDAGTCAVLVRVTPLPFPADDLCEEATSTSLSIGSVTSATTVSAAINDLPACGGASATNSPGVFFRLIGNGRWLLVTTCARNPTGIFDLQISNFTGNCGDLECLGGNADNAEGAKQD